jgi:predicted metal-dependent hydrolase
VPDVALPAAETVRVARELVETGRPFAAHEVLEARWKAGPAGEADLWQGLAQLAVGLTHEARGNDIGAKRLLERGSARLRSYMDTGGPTYGVDIPAVLHCVRR